MSSSPRENNLHEEEEETSGKVENASRIHLRTSGLLLESETSNSAHEQRKAHVSEGITQTRAGMTV